MRRALFKPGDPAGENLGARGSLFRRVSGL